MSVGTPVGASIVGIESDRHQGYGVLGDLRHSSTGWLGDSP